MTTKKKGKWVFLSDKSEVERLYRLEVKCFPDEFEQMKADITSYGEILCEEIWEE